MFSLKLAEEMYRNGWDYPLHLAEMRALPGLLRLLSRLSLPVFEDVPQCA